MSASLRRPTGNTTTGRRKAAAAAMILGSLVLLGTTLAGTPPPRNVLYFGLVLVIAWLIDGGTDRYVGAGLTATAVGGGITLGGANALDLSTGATEHILVYSFIGLALLIASFVDVTNIRSAALLLIFVGASAANQNFGVSFNLGWELAAILAIWGIIAFLMADRGHDVGTDDSADATAETATQSHADSLAPVDSGVGSGTR